MVQVYMEIDFIRLSLEYFLTKKKFEKLKKNEITFNEEFCFVYDIFTTTKKNNFIQISFKTSINLVT